MPKQTKKCRVCGASYEACRSVNPVDGVFNWREVACSPECGTIYLEKVIASRNKAVGSAADNKSVAVNATKKKRTSAKAVLPVVEEVDTVEVQEEE